MDEATAPTLLDECIEHLKPWYSIVTLCSIFVPLDTLITRTLVGQV